MKNLELTSSYTSDLKTDPIVSNWLLSIDASINTQRNYLQAINAFCTFTEKMPDELILEAEQEIKSGLLMRQRHIKIYLISFKKSLQDKGLAPMTVRFDMSGVKSFYRSCDIELPVLGRNKAKVLEKNKDIPTKEDLQEVLKICDPVERAVLLVGASSGLALNEIRNLKVKDFKKGYDPETEVTTLKLRRQKIGFDFITFLSPEASRAVQDYINYRGRPTKSPDPRKEKYLVKQRIYSDDDYLFICRKIRDSFINTKNDELRKFEDITLKMLYQILSEKSQKNTPKSDWNLIRSHNIRKWFNSAMLNAGADSFHVEFFMGHTLDDTRAAYFRANPEKLRELYLKYIPYLTLQKEGDISESPEYLRIKQENQILQAETALHVVERSELQELRAEMKKMKETTDSMESIKSEYMQFADLEKIREMKNKLLRELDEISKLKEGYSR